MPTAQQIEALEENPGLARARLEQGCCPWCGIRKRGVDFCSSCKGPWNIVIARQRFSMQENGVRQCPLCGKPAHYGLDFTDEGKRVWGSFCETCGYTYWMKGQKLMAHLQEKFPFLEQKSRVERKRSILFPFLTFH